MPWTCWSHSFNCSKSGDDTQQLVDSCTSLSHPGEPKLQAHSCFAICHCNDLSLGVMCLVWCLAQCTCTGYCRYWKSTEHIKHFSARPCMHFCCFVVRHCLQRGSVSVHTTQATINCCTRSRTFNVLEERDVRLYSVWTNMADALLFAHCYAVLWGSIQWGSVSVHQTVYRPYHCTVSRYYYNRSVSTVHCPRPRTPLWYFSLV
jgi:hypothetical protein